MVRTPRLRKNGTGGHQPWTACCSRNAVTATGSARKRRSKKMPRRGAVREIMIFLHAHGVGTARAVRIFKTYGHEAIRVMTEDPYRLARDVRGIGFRTADAMAAKLGIEKTAPQRLRAGVSFALQTATDEGHCGLPLEMLVTLAQKLLEVDGGLIRTALAEELLRGEDVLADTVHGEPCVFLKGLHGAERAIAERLVTRASGAPP